MICEALSDRMPEVAKGLAAWAADEAEHLGWCADCQAEWALVAPLARAAHARPAPAVDAERLAAVVTAQLRARPRVLPFVRRATGRRWVRPVLGLAAAAAVVFAFATVRPELPGAEVARGTTVRAPTAIPELDALLESELEVLLAAMDEPVPEYELQPSGIPRLGDLTADELEQLLETVEG